MIKIIQNYSVIVTARFLSLSLVLIQLSKQVDNLFIFFKRYLLRENNTIYKFSIKMFYLFCFNLV